MSKIIEVHPVAGKVIYTKPVWQWDYGCFLHLNDVELPFSYQAEFSNTSARGTAKSYTQTTDLIEIPRAYQESGEPIYIWIVVVDENSRTTEYSINTPVNRRSKSEESDLSPDERSELDHLRAALNSGVEHVEEIVENIQDRIEAALQEAKDSGEFTGPQGPQGKRGIQGEPGVSPKVIFENHGVSIISQ